MLFFVGIENNDLVVGMVSCFKPQKSPEDFIRLAFFIKKSISNIKFLLVGDGILRPSIENLIHRLNLKDVFILTGCRHDIPRILSSMDIFVLTSLWEGLPIAVLEAMALSLPVVVSDTGGISEVISDGKTGFLVPRRNLSKFLQKTLLLLKDKDLRLRIGSKAKESLDFSFTTKEMTQNVTKLFESVL